MSLASHEVCAGRELRHEGDLVHRLVRLHLPLLRDRRVTHDDRLRVQELNATLRRVLVMVISIRGSVEAVR